MDAPQNGLVGKPQFVAIEVAWPAGPERILVDLANLSLATEVCQTEQRYKATAELHVYETALVQICFSARMMSFAQHE